MRVNANIVVFKDSNWLTEVNYEKLNTSKANKSDQIEKNMLDPLNKLNIRQTSHAQIKQHDETIIWKQVKYAQYI